jgi:hypothetical protein
MAPTMAAALDVSFEGGGHGYSRRAAGKQAVLCCSCQRSGAPATTATRFFPAPQTEPGQILPPEGYAYTPASSLLCKFAHNSQNRVRCAVNVVAWQPDGRRCISGAQTGEITLWRGENFAYESVLQVGPGPGCRRGPGKLLARRHFAVVREDKIGLRRAEGLLHGSVLHERARWGGWISKKPGRRKGRCSRRRSMRSLRCPPAGAGG